MSRIGKMPIPVPKGAEVTIGAEQIQSLRTLGALRGGFVLRSDLRSALRSDLRGALRSNLWRSGGGHLRGELRPEATARRRIAEGAFGSTDRWR